MGLFKDCGCGCNGKRQQDKFVTSAISGLVFFIVANPQTYLFVRRVLGARIASPNGNPTLIGLLVHSLVFMLVVWGMMNIKGREKYESVKKAPAPAPAPAPAKAKPAMKMVKVAKAPAPGPSAKAQVDISSSEIGDLSFYPVETDLDLGSFDLQGAELGPSPAPANQMSCKCPDGSNVSVKKN
jgi:hypothetical protein